jgi:hypothetical protein
MEATAVAWREAPEQGNERQEAMGKLFTSSQGLRIATNRRGVSSAACSEAGNQLDRLPNARNTRGASDASATRGLPHVTKNEISRLLLPGVTLRVELVPTLHALAADANGRYGDLQQQSLPGDLGRREFCHTPHLRAQADSVARFSTEHPS